MTEYLQMGHMERVPPQDLGYPNHYYLPHLAAFKQTEICPKIRVVSNASAKSSNGLSVNDNLLSRSPMQDDLFSILCRFRTYKYALSADIAKMYRMIEVYSADSDYQRIL